MSEPSSDAARTCARCAAELSWGRFCTNCGARIDGTLGEAPFPVYLGRDGVDEPPGDQPAAPGLVGWRSLLVVAPLVVGLLVSGGIGAQMLWAQIPSKDPAAAPKAATVTCWDGLVRVSAECTFPSGAKGLRYVWPSLRRAGSSCRDVSKDRPESRRVEVWECRVRAGEANVTITYSEFTSTAAGLRFHQRIYGADVREAKADDESAARYVWRDAGDGRADDTEVASMYVRFPYAVSVRAPTRPIRDQALRTLVEFRPATDFRTRPASP